MIDVFVDELDLGKLGFQGVEPLATGRPAYHPSVLLKIYIYGYLNRIQSSRRLEQEAQRNVELMWLTGRLVPDFKTICSVAEKRRVGVLESCSGSSRSLRARLVGVKVFPVSRRRSVCARMVVHRNTNRSCLVSAVSFSAGRP